MTAISRPSVAVSGALSRSGLAAMRDIGQAGMRVVGLDRRTGPFGSHSRWSESYAVLPRRWSVTGFCDMLRERRIDAVLPMTSWLVRRLVPEREQVEQVAALNVPDVAALQAADDKIRTCTLCTELGIPVARLLEPGEMLFPVVVKPRCDIGGSTGVTLCRHREDLAAAIERCSGLGGALVQEYIPGDGDRMRTVVLLFDRDSRLVTHFTTRKLWTHPFEGGLSTLAVSTDDRGLVRQVLPLFEAVRWRGPAEVELKVDPRDGVAKVIEINPRFPGYVGFAVDCGLHLPRLAAQCALGQQVSPGPYGVGQKYVNAGLHMKTVFGRVRHGPDRAATLRRAVQASWNASWFALGRAPDPMGSLAKILSELDESRRGRSIRADEAS